MAERLVVIGGGAAGMSAASAARRVDADLAITVLESGPFSSYGVCGIPYYLGGVIADPETLVAYPAEEFRQKRRIDLRLSTVVTGIGLDSRVVTTDTDEHPYDALVLAAGARPIVPRVPGVDHPRVVTIRRLEDAIALRAELTGIRRAVVVGAGYVGLETAEALHAHGIAVTVVDRLPRVMSTLDDDVARLVEEEVRRHAELLLGRTLTAVEPVGDALRVHLGDESVETDLVVLALGVSPATELLAGSGAATVRPGALLVDDRMRTSLPGVYAAGDCVALRHIVTGEPAYVPLGPAANKTGRVAGTVAAGGDASFGGIAGTAVVKVFDLTVAHTGLTLADATDAGLAARATDVNAKSRAKYYPGAAPLRVRLVHTDDGRLLGAQLVGRDGAAQRVDVVAAALHGGMSVDDLAALDLAYAPPYSPVYDPLTQAAQAAQWALAPVGAR
jgi:NADPH-dependent 2,4-dienoyl-CoA reductase/sulfur reductase-like enzyme